MTKRDAVLETAPAIRPFRVDVNALEQFVTTIDGVDFHFIHVRSGHPNALPLV